MVRKGLFSTDRAGYKPGEDVSGFVSNPFNTDESSV